MDWAAHAQHRAQVIADDGQWIGLLDQDGVPLMDMAPLIELIAPETRNARESMQMTVRASSGRGLVHPVVGELIADGLGVVDEEGRLVPLVDDTRMVAIERPGGRRVFKVTHCVASGGRDAPSRLDVHAMGVLDLLDGIPCWSYPISITGDWHRLDQDFAAEWTRERDMQNLEMAATVDGFVVAGPALEVVHQLIEESLTATYLAVGITDVVDMPVIAVPPATAVTTPEVLVRPDDSSIWETVSSVAAAAGLTVSARMWWPGDDQVPAVTALHGPLTAPVVLASVEKSEVA